jgi:hypothetical protein
MNLKTIIASAAVAAGTVALTSTAAFAAPASPASPGSGPRPGGHQVSYEVDNGTTWTLTPNLRRARSTGPEKGYADAGVVVSLGSLRHFAGIRATGSKNLAENIWIADGPEAYVPGTHALSAGADFDYGFQQAGGYYMTDGKYAGQTLTLAQIRADFGRDQGYAWVGIDNAGSTEYGYVTSVNGRPVRDIFGLEAGAGRVTAYVLGF